MPNPSPKITELAQQDAIAVRGDVPLDEMPRFFERAFTAAAAAAEALGAEVTGPPFGFYPTMPNETVTIEAGFPVSVHIDGDVNDEVHGFVLPGGRVVAAMHVGPFETVTETYAELQSWMADNGLEPAVAMWERYLSDPRTEPDPATWRTKIVWPLDGR